jgi:hypothetical protein
LCRRGRTARSDKPQLRTSFQSGPPENEIVIIFDTTDIKKAKEFASSSNLKDVMTKAGVMDVPTMYFLESI